MCQKTGRNVLFNVYRYTLLSIFPNLLQSEQNTKTFAVLDRHLLCVPKVIILILSEVFRCLKRSSFGLHSGFQSANTLSPPHGVQLVTTTATA